MTREEQKKKREERRRRKAERRAKRVSRVRYSKSAPLVLEGTIEEVERSESALSALRGPASAIVGILPVLKPTRTGKTFAKELRIGMSVVGLMIAVMGGTMAAALGGCVVVMLGNTLPLAPATAARLQRRAGTIGSGRERRRRVEVGIAFDGRGVSVTRDGSTLRRVLTHEGEYRIAVKRVGDVAAVGVMPPGARKSEQLWFVAEGPEGVPVDASLLKAADTSRIDLAVQVDGSTLTTLHEAMRPDDVASMIPSPAD